MIPELPSEVDIAPTDTADDIERKAVHLRKNIQQYASAMPEELIQIGIDLFTEVAVRMRETGKPTFKEWTDFVDSERRRNG